MKKLNFLQKGTTIIEMMMYMVIFAILMTILTQIFTSILDSETESKATSSVEQDGAYLLSRLSYDVKRAQAVISPTTYGVASTSATLNIGGINYTYSSSPSGNMILINNQGTNVLNSSDTTIANLTFKRIGNVGGKSTLIINYQMVGTTQRVQGYERRNYQTTVSLR
ncbi:MAG TPA: hypothetical protein VMR41_01125 [Patescibacteria group bacterium]|nr:hypothetical protein [Patescibacteria group bacterium]